jgi:chemotaxis protein methyltransferase CheR
MKQEEFDYLRDMLKARSGLVLGDEKRYLLESRLMPVAREIGLESLSGLVSNLKTDDSDELREKITQAMTINESFFFRDKSPFENFKNIMAPALLASSRAASRNMRIWCAASSTGQEPYSLAILIKEMSSQFAGWNIQIIGTDLSEEVLEKAKSGLYSQFEVQRGLPVQLMVKYFQQTGSMWQIDSSIRSMVTYKHFNLLEDYAPLGMFDVIFCRNVLIYFDAPTKSDMLGRMAKRMRPDGYLVLGAAETVIGISEEFKPLTDARGLYSLQAGAPASALAPASIAPGVTPAAPAPATTPAVPGLSTPPVKTAAPAAPAPAAPAPATTPAAPAPAPAAPVTPAPSALGVTPRTGTV